MFRAEAVEYNKNLRWESKVLLFSGVPSWVFGVISWFLLTIFILSLIFLSFTRRVEVSGELISFPHPSVISSPKSGYVSEVLVSIGDKVEKNQPLFKIKQDRIVENGDVGINSGKLIRSQIKQNDNIINNLKKNKENTINNLKSQINQNSDILKDINENLEQLKKNILDIQKLVDTYRKLQLKGMSSKQELISMQINLSEQKSAYQNLYSKFIQQKIIISNLENDIKNQQNQFDSSILEYQIKNDELNVRLLESDSSTEILVSSPSAGVIETINVTTGQLVDIGSILTKVSHSDKKQYKLVFWVPHTAIAYVNPAQHIKIRYNAFPYEKFGQFNGIIETVSDIPASAQELSFYKNSQMNSNPDNPLYKVIVLIDKNYVVYDNKVLFLNDGMKAEATLFLEKRKLYQWILMPLYSIQKTIDVI